MSDIDEIKSKLDIVSFVGNYVSLKKSGRNFTGLCPFHIEKSPSFIVSPERQIWHCFGACSEGGDVISFLMKIDNIDFPEALEELSKQTGVKLTSSYKVTPDQKIKDDIYKANLLASRFYHYLLTKHKLGGPARKYLRERKTSDKIIETFVLGYAPESWDSLYTYLSKKGFSDFILTKAGLVLRGRSGKHFDRFRGRLMFTLKNHRGDVVGFSGRILPLSKLKDREAKYINSSETPVYIKGNTLYGLDITKDAIRKENKAVVVEGEFDMLSSFAAGVPFVVAIKGTALTENQAKLLKRFCDTIIFALDSDIAGGEAAKRGITIAEKEGFAISVVDNTTGKDPDDVVKDNPATWKKSVIGAVSVYDYLLNESLKRFNKDDAYGKKKIADWLLPFYFRITNTIVQTHYLNLLSGVINIPAETLREEMDTLVKKERLPMKEDLKNNKERITKEEYFLSLVLQNSLKKNIDMILVPEKQSEVITSLTNPAIVRILVSFFTYITHLKDEMYQSPAFIKTLDSELIPLADKLYLFNLGFDISDKQQYSKVLEKILKDIVVLYLRRTLKDLSTKLAQDDNDDRRSRINKDFNNIRKRLNKLDSDSRT
ncbi:DNA primase [Candidatus Gottesmanbacteria bacterium]|nr:DNA primase [Candidatus Gottesmanbacteria bacterium]